MNITFSFITIGIVAAMILVFGNYIKFKTLKLIAKIILFVCVIGAIFFYLKGIDFDLTKITLF